MTHKAWFPLVSLTVLLAAAPGCGGSGSSSSKDGAAGSTGSGGAAGSNGDGAIRGEVTGTGGADDAGGVDASGGGGATGTGGTSGAPGTDAANDPGRGGSGGNAIDAPREGPPPDCQAGEMCTGTFMCNATRCIRGERQVCHCVSGSLFCGPAECDTPDANAPDVRRDTGMMTPMCAANTQTGDDCMSATDRMCETACVLNRQRVCFCNAATDNWFCSGFMRCN